MANHKSAMKAHKQSLQNKARNQSTLSRIKTIVKKFEATITARNLEAAKDTLRLAESAVMRGVTKGVYKLNTASRKVSRFARQIKALESR